MASGASFTSNSDVTQPAKQELLTAFLDLRTSPTNCKNMLEFVHRHYSNRLKTPELEEPGNHGEARIAPSIFHDLSCLYHQQVSLRKTLQSLDSISGEDLDRVDTWRKVSAVLFTAAAANTKKNRAGAAAVSVILVALGKWIHSILRKRESAAIKRKHIVGVMIFGAKIGIEYLSDIHALALCLNLESESKPETVDGEWKSFEELRGKVDDYNRNLKWVREVVLLIRTFRCKHSRSRCEMMRGNISQGCSTLAEKMMRRERMRKGVAVRKEERENRRSLKTSYFIVK